MLAIVDPLWQCARENIPLSRMWNSQKKTTGFAHKNTASKMYYGLVGGYHPYKLCSHCEFRKNVSWELVPNLWNRDNEFQPLEKTHDGELGGNKKAGSVKLPHQDGFFIRSFVNILSLFCDLKFQCWLREKDFLTAEFFLETSQKHSQKIDGGKAPKLAIYFSN